MCNNSRINNNLFRANIKKAEEEQTISSKEKHYKNNDEFNIKQMTDDNIFSSKIKNLQKNKDSNNEIDKIIKSNFY